MDYNEVEKIWNPIFKKLGCRKSNENNWVLEMQDLIVLFSYKVHTGIKEYYIDLGIIIKKWRGDRIFKRPLIDNYDHDVEQGLFALLLHVGGPEYWYYLNNLICYDPEINTDDEIKENCNELAILLRRKVMPIIERLDLYAWMTEDFYKRESWKPFLRYFRPCPEVDDYFGGLLKKYYLKE
jgi:hypothetical protein